MFFKNIIFLLFITVQLSSNSIDMEKLWTFETANKITSKITIDDRYLYLGSYDGRVYKIDRESGKEIWKFQTNYHISSNILKDNNNIYFGSNDNYIYALNKNDASLVWKFKTKDMITRSGVFYKDKVIFASADGYIYILDKKSGNLTWKISPDDTSICTDLILKNDILYVSTIENRFYAIELDSKSIIWNISISSRVQTKPFYNKGTIYICDTSGSIYSIDAKTGKIKNKSKVFLGTYADTTVINNTLYFIAMDNTIYAIQLDTLQIKSQYQANKSLTAIANIFDDIYVGNEAGEILIFDKHLNLKDTKIVAKAKINSIVFNNYQLFLADNDGFLNSYFLRIKDEIPPKILTPPTHSENTNQGLTTNEFFQLLKKSSIGYKKVDDKTYRVFIDNYKGTINLNLCENNRCNLATLKSYIYTTNNNSKRTQKLKIANKYNQLGRFVRYVVDDKNQIIMNMDLELNKELTPKELKIFIIIEAAMQTKIKSN